MPNTCHVNMDYKKKCHVLLFFRDFPLTFTTSKKLCHLEEPDRGGHRLMRVAETHNVFVCYVMSFTFKFVLTSWSIGVATIVGVLRVHF